MIVRVEAKHIINGQKNDCHCCPIALALRAAGYKFAEVKDVYFHYEAPSGSWVKIPLPVEATRFIHNFDDGLKTRPFEFSVNQ